MKMMKPSVRAADTRRVKPRPKTVDPFYSSAAYRGWRQQILARAGGRCQDTACKDPTRAGMTLFADHIVELKDGGAPLDLSNGMARCGSCHTTKTLRARGERSRQVFRPDDDA